MKLQYLTLILVLGLCNYVHRLPGSGSPSSQSDCPTVMIEAPKDIEGSELRLQVHG